MTVDPNRDRKGAQREFAVNLRPNPPPDANLRQPSNPALPSVSLWGILETLTQCQSLP